MSVRRAERYSPRSISRGVGYEAFGEPGDCVSRTLDRAHSLSSGDLLSTRAFMLGLAITFAIGVVGFRAISPSEPVASSPSESTVGDLRYELAVVREAVETIAVEQRHAVVVTPSPTPTETPIPTRQPLPKCADVDDAGIMCDPRTPLPTSTPKATATPAPTAIPIMPCDELAEVVERDGIEKWPRRCISVERSEENF